MSHQPVITMDWTATFLELAGAKPPLALDGVSLVDHMFKGRQVPQRDLFWRMRDAREQPNLARSRPAELAALRAAWEAIDGTLLPY